METLLKDFYREKRVFVTGHTGFKGSWMCKMLTNAGAIVTGYSLAPNTNPSLFEIAGLDKDIHSVIGEIRDYEPLKKAFDEAQPEIVLHLAAQPIVRDSYKDPTYTYETNVMGTVNILECVRNSNCVQSFLNVTTDKAYLNKEGEWGYREDEELDGYFASGSVETDEAVRLETYKKAQQRLADLAVQYPIVTNLRILAVTNDVSGIDEARLIPIYTFSNFDQISF